MVKMVGGTSRKVRGHILDISGTHLGLRVSAQSGCRSSRDRGQTNSTPTYRRKYIYLSKILAKAGLAPKSSQEQETCFAFPYVIGSIIFSPQIVY